MSKDGESAVTAEMRQWSCQCNSIRVGLALGSPTKYHNFSKGRLDGIMGLAQITSLMDGMKTCW